MINPIIESIIDNDLYLFNMQWAAIRIFPELNVRFRLKVDPKISFPSNFDIELRKQINYLKELSMNESDFIFMNTIRHFPKAYINFLKLYKFNPAQVKIKQFKDKLDLILEGHFTGCVLWTTPLLSIISELYYIMTNSKIELYDFLNKDMAKAKFLKDNDINFGEIGQKARYSFENHDRIIHILSNYRPNFVGTNNLYLAKKYQLKPIGTFTDSWVKVHGALYGYNNANKMALENWCTVYGGDLGIALTDIYTSDVFYKSFDLKFAKLFDGVRQHSGDPYIFIDKTINHYKSLKIDPLTKTIIFSDRLTLDKALKIKEYCKNKIKCSFAFRQFFTNDVGVLPLDISMNIDEILINSDWVPIVKLSDDPAKYEGDPGEIEHCKYKLKIS